MIINSVNRRIPSIKYKYKNIIFYFFPLIISPNNKAMLRTTKKATDSSFVNLSTLNASTLTTETLSETMQREIDNYTRRLEQDKRKFFRAQENYSQIKKEFDNKNKELEKLKSRKSKTQIMTLRGKISTLEGTLDQTINSYNEALAKNNKLKLQIDQVRKDKKNESQQLKFLNASVEQITKEIEEKQMEIEQKKSAVQKMKESIIRVREDNQASMKLHEQQIHMIKNNFDRTGREEDRKQNQDASTKTESIDTQPILKLRLRNLITKNKEKIKIIDQYKRNMHLIYQNFEQIKQESGIQDLQEITKTFLKQEEQNLFIYQYMSRLNSSIESLQEGNAQIKKKIAEQQEINRERRVNLTGTPEEAKRKRDFETYKEEKSRTINLLKESLEQIKPKLHQLLKEYNLISESEEFDLNQGNIEMYIAQIEDLINSSNVSFETVYKGEFKEDITRYTKLPPSILNEESKEKADEKLLEKEKLKELAGEYWEKKKALKTVGTKGQQSMEDSSQSK